MSLYQETALSFKKVGDPGSKATFSITGVRFQHFCITDSRFGLGDIYHHILWKCILSVRMLDVSVVLR